MFNKKKILFILSILVFGTAAHAEPRVLVHPPQKFLDAELETPAPADKKFTSEQIETSAYVKIKNSEWQACRQESAVEPQRNPLSLNGHGLAPLVPHFAPLVPHLAPQSPQLKDREIGYKDRLQTYFENRPYIKSLSQMSELGYDTAELSERPWSGDYWSISRGILGVRAFDSDFREKGSWLERFRFIMENPMQSLVEKYGQDAIPRLSPSEKYDLLIGAGEQSLTVANWSEGKTYQDDKGQVENWMGICHGWAPASFMVGRPTKTVQAKSFDEKWSVTFTPSEIKGYASYVWANNDYPVHFLGQRCNLKNPPVDENDRFKDPQCFDLNPGVWHIVVVNQLANFKTSFVMDATYDYEVWNQPVFAYRVKYFNPESKQEVQSLEQAQIARSEFSSDRFAKFRDTKTTHIVGVKMRVGYVAETQHNEREVDSQDYDSVRWVEYVYDLELDKNGDIIGGEWQQMSHPDFVWRPNSKADPNLRGEKSLPMLSWSRDQRLATEWSEYANMAAEQGLVVNSIIKKMIEESRK